MKKQWFFLGLLPLLFLIFGFGLLEKKDPASYTYTLDKIVIDAGHGGKDPGCSGHGSREKEITLEIALKLGDYIRQNLPDVEVIYTRTEDVFIELDERANIANKNNADLFISIHCNSVPNSPAHGTETFVMGQDKSAANLSIAKRENDVILLEEDYLTSYDGFDPNSPETHIIFSLYQNAFLEQSVRFASLCEDQFKNRAMRKSRGVKQANFLVLYKTSMPSVLIETGFLSHSAEEKYLLSDNGQSYIASAIYRAFKIYKEDVENQKAPEIIKSQKTQEIPDRVIPNPVDLKKEEPFNESDNNEIVFLEDVNAPKNIKVYRIMLYSSVDNFDVGNANFDEVEAIEIDSDNRGIKRYLINQEFESKSACQQKLDLIKKAGFRKAKMLEYVDDQLIK